MPWEHVAGIVLWEGRLPHPRHGLLDGCSPGHHHQSRRHRALRWSGMGLEPGSSWCFCNCTTSWLSLGDRVPSHWRQWASSASSPTIRVTMGSSTGWAYPKTFSCGRDTAGGWEFITWARFQKRSEHCEKVIGSVISRQITISRSDQIPRTIPLRTDHDPGDPARY